MEKYPTTLHPGNAKAGNSEVARYNHTKPNRSSPSPPIQRENLGNLNNYENYLRSKDPTAPE